MSHYLGETKHFDYMSNHLQEMYSIHSCDLSFFKFPFRYCGDELPEDIISTGNGSKLTHSVIGVKDQ